MSYTNKLNGARVLIIGGSSGIGRAVAEASVQHGCTVIISSSQQSRIDAAIEVIKKSSSGSSSGSVVGKACDLSKQAELESNIKSLLDFATENGSQKLDHIIYTAGDALAIKPLDSIDMEAAVQIGMVRFFGSLFVGKHAAAYMKSGPAASIILTTGAISQKPQVNWTVVASYATALQGLTRGLALDLKPIRVNLISPGAVDTELWGAMPKEQLEGMKKHLEGSVPTGRIGRAEDVAEAYLYLMKDHNATGAMVSTSSGSLLV